MSNASCLGHNLESTRNGVVWVRGVFQGCESETPTPHFCPLLHRFENNCLEESSSQFAHLPIRGSGIPALFFLPSATEATCCTSDIHASFLSPRPQLLHGSSSLNTRKTLPRIKVGGLRSTKVVSVVHQRKTGGVNQTSQKSQSRHNFVFCGRDRLV